MNIPIRPPVFSQEHSDFRKMLRAKLNINNCLSKRTAFNVGDEGIHCELYEHSADAPTIIFLPGIGTYCELYSEFLFKLSQEGFNVVGIDPPGHGYSAGERGLYTVETVSRAISTVVDVLEQRFHGGFGIYGYSIGALLAVACAERDCRISSVLCGTLLIPDIAPDISYRLGWNWTWFSSLFMPTYKVPLKTFVDFELLLKNHPAGEDINNDPLVVFDYPLKTLSSLFNHHCKIVNAAYEFDVAILQGDQDEILPLSYARRVIQQCKQPIELIVMQQQGHMVPFTSPNIVVFHASQWFKREFAEKAA